MLLCGLIACAFVLVSGGSAARISGLTKNDIFTTIVGNDGPGGYGGDGGPVADALLHFPRGVAVDRQGNVFITDTENNRVRKVTPCGTISTIAGTGKAGLSGVGGPAVKALATQRDVSAAWYMAIDRRGDVFFTGSHRVHEVTPDGIIHTFAGNGSNDKVPESGIPATSAYLKGAGPLATDKQGNLYIADSIGNRDAIIRRVGTDGIIRTIAGKQGGSNKDGVLALITGITGFGGLATDGNGNLYYGETYPNPVGSVRKIRAGFVTTVIPPNVDGRFKLSGKAKTAVLIESQYLATDTQGDLYVLDGPGSRVIKVWNPQRVPHLTLSGPASQHVGQHGIVITVNCTKPCSLIAVGSVTVSGQKLPFKLRGTNAGIGTSGCPRTLTLRFQSASQEREIKTLLVSKLRPHAVATITVRSYDADGHEGVTRRRVVRVLP